MLIEELHRLGEASLIIALSFIAIASGYSIFLFSIVGHISSPETSIGNLALGVIVFLSGFSLLLAGSFSMYLSSKRLSRYIKLISSPYILISIASLFLILYPIGDFYDMTLLKEISIGIGIPILSVGVALSSSNTEELEALGINLSLSKNLLLISGILTLIGVGILLIPIAFFVQAFSLLSIEGRSKEAELLIEESLLEEERLSLLSIAMRIKKPLYVVYDAAIRVAERNNYEISGGIIIR